MTTPRQLITGALRLINVVQANENPTAADMDISFEALNAMLDSWSTEKLSIFSMNPYEFLLEPGVREYTLGEGGDWDIERPMEPTMMYIMYGDEAPAPTPPPELNFIYYGSFVVRNGYDGDTGVYGYVPQSNPFVSPFSVFDTPTSQEDPYGITVKDYLTVASADFSMLTTGGGNSADPVGNVGPRDFTDYSWDWVDNGFYQRRFYLPMSEGDQIWVVDTYFAGYGETFSVDVVVGPSPTEGEWYNCYGNAVSDPLARIVIERLAWAGDR